jgi:hypothetical protein
VNDAKVKVSGMRVALVWVLLLQVQNQQAVNANAKLLGLRVAVGYVALAWIALVWVLLLQVQLMTRLDLSVRAIALNPRRSPQQRATPLPPKRR